MKIWTEEKLIEEGYEIRNAQIKGAELTNGKSRLHIV